MEWFLLCFESKGSESAAQRVYPCVGQIIRSRGIQTRNCGRKNPSNSTPPQSAAYVLPVSRQGDEQKAVFVNMQVLRNPRFHLAKLDHKDRSPPFLCRR